MINEFKYDQTWKIWPSPLSLSLYSTFNAFSLALRSWYTLAFTYHKHSCFCHSAVKASFTSTFLFASNFDIKICFPILSFKEFDLFTEDISFKIESINYQSILFVIFIVILSSNIWVKRKSHFDWLIFKR